MCAGPSTRIISGVTGGSLPDKRRTRLGDCRLRHLRAAHGDDGFFSRHDACRNGDRQDLVLELDEHICLCWSDVQKGLVETKKSRRWPEGYWAAQYACRHLAGLEDLRMQSTAEGIVRSEVFALVGDVAFGRHVLHDEADAQ